MRVNHGPITSHGNATRHRLAGLVILGLVGAWLPLAPVTVASAAAVNVANQATVTASSQNTSAQQTAVKAVDGSALGYPANSTKEWATVGGKAGSWLELTWSTPMRIEKVVLYDRPNTNDRITAANLVFSDNSTIPTGSLANSGATTLTLPSAVVTTRLRVAVTKVAATTENVGLAEIEVWGAKAENRGPVANAGTNTTSPADAKVTLDGSASTDPDGDALTYAWAQTSGPAVQLAGATTVKPTFTPTETGLYTFGLTVTDPKGLSSAASVSVTVRANQAPAANAGADQSVYTGASSRLDGTASKDPENQTLTYAWQQVGASPAAVTLSGATTAQPTFTPTVAGTYTFRLIVNDGQASSAADEVKVTASAPPATATNLAGSATTTASSADTAAGNGPAKAIDGYAQGYPANPTREWVTLGGKAGSWLQLTWPTPVVVDRVVLYDRPNTNDRITGATLAFSDGSSVSTGALVNAGTATTVSFTARTVTSVRLKITSVSTKTENTGLAEIQVWGFLAANRAPLADAGPDLTGLTGARVVLDGSASLDPDGNPLTYAWAQTAGPAGTLGQANEARASFVGSVVGDYELTLTVSDGKLQSSDKIALHVAENRMPTANAGTDISALTGKTITLDGSGSNDPDGTSTLSYSWTQVGATPAAATLTGAGTATPTFIAKAAGTYTFRLTVTDSVSTATDDVTVTVTQAPNPAPVANAGPDQASYPTALVTLDGSASTDADGDLLTYSWALTSGSGVTLANPTTAKPTFAAAVNGTYAFTLTVNDGQVTSTDVVTVTVTAAGTLAVTNNGTRAVWTADFRAANAGKSVQLQKQTIVTKQTSEVTAASWVTVANATSNSTGIATFTIADPLEVSHSYRAVINPTSPSPQVTDIVTYAAPHAAMTPTTGLATVYIDTNEGGTINSTETYWEGRMTMTAASAAAGTTSTPCAAATNLAMKVAGRGNYSWTLDKKPYKISLDKKANLCGMGEAKKWALIANHYDRSLLRNTVAMKMGQGMSNLAYTPDSVPVDVYVNGTYQGSYTLMERVNVGAGRVANGANELKDNAGGANDSGLAVTGTYLLEWDFREGGDHNVVVGDSGTIAINEPEDEDDGSGITTAQINYISDYLIEADKMVFADNFAHPTNGWRKYIDEASLIDWYIIQELTKNLDSNLYTSCVMYKTRDTATTPGKLFFGPIWDFDTSMGSATYPANQGTTTGWYLRNENAAIEAKMTEETWLNRLFTDPTFAANVEARWKQVYPTLSQSISFIDSQKPLVSTSAAANFAKWDITEELEDVQVIKGSWTSEVTYLRSWLSSRLAWMNAPAQLG